MYGKKANSIFKRRNLLIMLCLIFFGISSTIILALVLGQKSGDFVIRVQDGNANKSIMLTTKEPAKEVDKETLTPLLTPKGVSGFSDYSPYYFLRNGFETLEEYTSDSNPEKVDGLYTHSEGLLGANDQSVSLYCYTFYIVNTGSSGVNVDLNMDYALTKGEDLDDIIRVMSYTKDDNNDKAIIYQKPDSIEYDYTRYPTYKGISLKTFTNDSIIFNDETIFVDIGSYAKYSIIFWIEGDDPDSTINPERFYSQSIKFELNLTVNMG